MGSNIILSQKKVYPINVTVPRLAQLVTAPDCVVQEGEGSSLARDYCVVVVFPLDGMGGCDRAPFKPALAELGYPV